MQKLVVAAVVIFGIAGALRYANANYEELMGGAKSFVANQNAQTDAQREAEITANLAMIADPEFLLLDPPNHTVQGRYQVQVTINTDLRDEAQETAAAFVAQAIDGDRAWTGATVRLQHVNQFKVWLSDIEKDQTGQNAAGTNDITLTGRIVRGLSDTSDLPPSIGRRVTFRQSEIWDWAITHEGRVYGLYTIRRNLDSLPPEMAALAKANLSEDPVPSGW